MHISLKLLQARMAIPNAIKSKITPAPPLPEAKWDYPQAGRHYTVGAAKVDLTPGDLLSKKYYMAGYGVWKPIRGILNPVYATALWLDDNSGRGGILLVSVDCVGIMNNDVEAIRQRLAPFRKRTGCRAVHVMATHCHASIDSMGFWGPLPKTGRDKTFFRILFGAIESAAEQAYATRRCGDLYAGSVETEGIQQDKRLPDVFDNVATRLRFVPFNGGREVHVVNYASHPEVLGSKNKLLSSDWVHWFREKLDENNAEVVYFNGAIGGMITPTCVEGAGESVESAIAAGVMLADATLSITNERKLEPRIGLARKEFYIEMSNWVFGLCGKLRVLPRERYYTGEGSLNASMKTEVNYLRIGDVNILMIPGEPFPELAMGGYLPAEIAAAGGPEMNPVPWREAFNDPNLLIFGLANDEIGYIIPPNDFVLDEKWPCIIKTDDHGGRRHYEEINSLGPRTAHIVAQAVEDLRKATEGG